MALAATRQELESTRNYLVSKLNEWGFENITFSTPCTTNGCSFYTTANAKNNDTIKFRTSDHCTGDYRMMSEVHLNTIEAVDRWFLQVEMIRFPERFESRRIVKTFTFPKKGFQAPKGEIIEMEEFVSKKGNATIRVVWAINQALPIRKAA